MRRECTGKLSLRERSKLKIAQLAVGFGCEAVKEPLKTDSQCLFFRYNFALVQRNYEFGKVSTPCHLEDLQTTQTVSAYGENYSTTNKRRLVHTNESAARQQK